MKHPEQGSILVIFLIVAIVGILFIGGGLFYLGTTRQQSPSPKPKEQSVNDVNVMAEADGEQIPEVSDSSSFVYKSIREFFPVEIDSYKISPIGVESYLVGPLGSTVYARAGASESEVEAKVVSSYYADYKEPSSDKHYFQVVYYKFPNKQELEDAETVTKELYASLAEGFQKVTFSGIEYPIWPAYREVPGGKGTDFSSGDVRVLLAEALTMVRLSFFGNISQSEMESLVKSYFQAIQSSNIAYATDEQILTLAKLQEWKTRKTNEEYNRRFEENSRKMDEEFEKKVQELTP